MIKPTCQTIVICLTTALVSWAGSCAAADKPFTHPGILHSRAELDFVKAQVTKGEEPWKSAWEELRSHSISKLDWINEFGEYQESGRDQAYTQMGLGYLACAAEIAWTQGVDLYGAYDNRLATGYECTAKYNLGHDVPYEPYRSHAGRYNYPAISEQARGRFGSIYERVYHHYHVRMGLEMSFTAQVVEKIRPERWQTAYASWGTLMHAGQPIPQREKENGGEAR